MAAEPVGYEAFHSLRRKTITLICFLLASTMAIGITVYVDSFSVHEWNKNIDVGDIAITVEGSDVAQYVDDIQGIDGVTRAEDLRSVYGRVILNESVMDYRELWGQLLTPDTEFLEAFPNYIQLELGRFPTGPDEIAVINWARTYEDMNLSYSVTLNI